MTEPISDLSSPIKTISFSGIHVPFLLCFSWAGFATSPVQEKNNNINSTEVMTYDVSDCLPQVINNNYQCFSSCMAQVTAELLAPLFFTTVFRWIRCRLLSDLIESCRVILKKTTFKHIIPKDSTKYLFFYKAFTAFAYRIRAPPSEI